MPQNFGPDTQDDGGQLPVPTNIVGIFSCGVDPVGTLDDFVRVAAAGSNSPLPPDWALRCAPGKESWFRPTSLPAPPASFLLVCNGHYNLIEDPSQAPPEWFGSWNHRGKDTIGASLGWANATPPAQLHVLKKVWRNNNEVPTTLADKFAVSFVELDGAAPKVHWWRSLQNATSPFTENSSAFVPVLGDRVLFTLSSPLPGTWQRRALPFS
jgi:hypothetical protein